MRGFLTRGTRNDPTQGRRSTLLTKDEIKARALVKMVDGSAPPDEFYDETHYNLRLGGEYILIEDSKAFKQLQVKDCSNGAKRLTIPPFACVLVGSDEVVDLPADVFGRWGLKIRPALSGLVFQAGPQIEPGSNTRLYGLLFNLSATSRHLTYRQKLWSIDFECLAAPVAGGGASKGPIRDINAYLTDVPTGSLNEVFSDYRKLQRANGRSREFAIPVLLALVTVIASTALPVVVTKVADMRQSYEQLRQEVSILQTQVDQLRGPAIRSSPSSTVSAPSSAP